jgi:DNA-binding MarR family transcriptional regulator
MFSTEEITDEILVSLRKIIRGIDLESKALVLRCGLTGPQLVILKELNRNGRMSSGCLAEKVSLSQATVTGIVDRLEARNLVVRSRDEADRRRVIISCTSDGKKLADSVPSILQERFVERLGKLADWERLLILSSLQRIDAIMATESISAEPILDTDPLMVTSEVTGE